MIKVKAYIVICMERHSIKSSKKIRLSDVLLFHTYVGIDGRLKSRRLGFITRVHFTPRASEFRTKLERVRLF